MKLDNRKNVIKIWFKKLVAVALFTSLVITIGFTDFFMTPVFGIEKIWYLVILIVVFVCLAVYNFLLKEHFVFFSDNGDKIILRYYPVRILNQKKNSIEIPKQSFVSWEIKKFFFGKYEILYVTGKFKTRLASYPGISLSAVNDSDRKKIKSALNLYVKKKFYSN